MPYKSIPNVICEHCERSFDAKEPTQRFCSKACKDASETVTLPPPNPSGLCMCGCGEKVTRAKLTCRRNGYVKGEYVRFKTGHHARKSAVNYVEEDRGFTSPCWIWQRTTRTDGYAVIKVNGKEVPAHRAYYERHVGPIPDGLVLDHLCCQPLCVNPDHLDPVTRGENARRGSTIESHRRHMAR